MQLMQTDAISSVGTFWERNGDAIEGLGIIAGGILLYGLVVNFFYQIISKRVMFAAKTYDGRDHVGGPGRGFVYLMMFPLISFAYFLVLSLALLFLGGENQTTQQVITLSFAVVAAVRISAYFSEATSHDVAKMLPLGLLGVILVQAEFQSLKTSLASLQEFFNYSDLVILYFAVVVVLEYALRSFYMITHISESDRRPQSQPRQPAKSRSRQAPEQSNPITEK